MPFALPSPAVRQRNSHAQPSSRVSTLDENLAEAQQQLKAKPQPKAVTLRINLSVLRKEGRQPEANSARSTVFDKSGVKGKTQAVDFGASKAKFNGSYSKTRVGCRVTLVAY